MRWLWLIIWLAMCLPASVRTGSALLYLQHDNISRECPGRYYSYNITTCVLDRWGQCPQEGGDTISGVLGNDALAFRYSTVVPREDWGTGDYVVTTKITLIGENTSYKVRLSRVSGDCRTTHETLGELGPFLGPSNALLEFRFKDVSSFRASLTDRIAVDFISSGRGFYTFGTSYGHAEYLLMPSSSCAQPNNDVLYEWQCSMCRLLCP